MNTSINFTLHDEDIFKQDKTISLERDFSKFVVNSFKKTNAVCYYPSAGVCIDDILFFDREIKKEKGSKKNIPIKIETYKPSLYIHTDALNYGSDMGLILESKGFKILENLRVENTSQIKPGEKTTSIIKFIGKFDNRICYLWHIQEMKNEIFLRDIVLSCKFKIPVIYSVCDGILHGMGRAENSIPTALYPLIAGKLGIRYIITEQSFQFLDSMNNQGIPDIKDWIKNLYSCIPTDEIKFLSNMTEDKIKTIVNGVLSKIPETKTGKWFYNAEIVIKDLTETRRNNLIKFQH